MKTLREFKQDSHIDSDLIAVVVRQLGGWEAFKESAEDITNHGISGGFTGFIYYTDTEEFTERNKSLILNLAKEQADDFGSENIFAMLAGFNCLDLSAEEIAEAIYNDDSEDRTTVFNALAWYAGEEVARAYTDLI